MSEIGKTLAFVIISGLLAAAATWTWLQTQPVEVVGFEKVGEEFFGQFDDGLKAQSLEVIAYDAETDGLKEFTVRYEDGAWRIPSHHNYPAEAAERLAKTATSLIGLTRESIVARRTNKHAELGVLDPADNDADPNTAGQRIRLKDANGDILADYIIGKPAGRAAEENTTMVRELGQQDEYFFVRVPSEKETYKAKVQIDLSTRFSDWINPDLLKVESDDINRLEIDNYELQEQNVQVSATEMRAAVAKQIIDQQRLVRTDGEPWNLEGLVPETEELDTAKVDEILNLLDSMTIVGVRPKLSLDGQPLVKSDLSINRELAQKNPQLFQQAVYQLQQDLESKGFTIGAADGNPESAALLGSRGELRAATAQGVLYTLYFGRAVSGDIKQIEIGGATNAPKTESKSDSDRPKPANAETEATATSQDESRTTDNKSRFVAIRVDFDESALGPKPTPPNEPAKPVMPKGYEAWKAKQQPKDPEKPATESDAVTGDEKSGGDEKPTDDSPQVPEDIEKASELAFKEYEKAVQEYEQAEIQYSTDLELYEAQKNGYDRRAKIGKDLVEELNDRFGSWFYVVPAESLATLKLNRGDLVIKKETPPPKLNAPTSPGDRENLGTQLPPAPNINAAGEQVIDKEAGKEAECA